MSDSLQELRSLFAACDGSTVDENASAKELFDEALEDFVVGSVAGEIVSKEGERVLKKGLEKVGNA